MRPALVLFITLLFVHQALAQLSNVWVADQGNGRYINPIIHADYSDPDVCRVGDDYYMVSSSFNTVPGLPILHSKDLVNWKLIGHALEKLIPEDHFSKVQHGNGVWAPSIRYHNDQFWIYYPDPDFGIYLTKAKDPAGPWTEPILIAAGKGLIDPCPLFDDDGRNYLVHAFAGSRASIKSVIVIKELSSDGSKVISEGKIVYDGHEIDPTIEGPKFYKRNGYYYIFAPAGGVKTGWQTVLRSKEIYGPYERKIVMEQGSTKINGPHQGAWVDTPKGEDWFIHFQDKGAYGRIVHLQPMKWDGDWPVIGFDENKDGIGEPVLQHKKPIKGSYLSTPVDTDDFNTLNLGLQWQWQANPKPKWYYMFPANSVLRLYSQFIEDDPNYWTMPNLLLQKLPADEFIATTKINFNPNPELNDEKIGFILLGQHYGAITVTKTSEGLFVLLEEGNSGDGVRVINRAAINASEFYLRVTMRKGSIYHFSFSTDNNDFIDFKEEFIATPGKWIGAKLGFFCIRKSATNDSGFADIDWLRFEPLSTN